LGEFSLTYGEGRKKFRQRPGAPLSANLRGELFPHKPAVCGITDIELAARDNGNLIGAVESVPVFKTALEAAPNLFSVLFDGFAH
jgi:hypothetical protein